MIVVDANAVALLLLGRDDERAVMTRLVRDHDAWLAPALWSSEFLSVLRRHVVTGRLSEVGACALYHEASDLVTASSAPPVPEHVLHLSRTSGCTTYDCEYVALAIETGVPLLTLDRQVLKAFPAVAASPLYPGSA